MVAHQPRNAGAQSRHASPGQGSEVNNGIGLCFRSQRQSISEHQAALGIGVEHLNGFTITNGQHIAWAGGVAAQHVVGHGHVGLYLAFWRQRRQGRHRTHHSGRPTHVHFHIHHGLTGFNRKATSVEGDAFTYQSQGAGSPTFRGVGKFYKTRGVGGPPVDAQETAQAGPLDGRFIHDLYRETGFFSHAPHLVSKLGGGQAAARFVNQITGQTHPRQYRFGIGYGSFCCGSG